MRSHIEKKVTDLAILQNCMSEKAPGSKKLKKSIFDILKTVLVVDITHPFCYEQFCKY